MLVVRCHISERCLRRGARYPTFLGLLAANPGGIAVLGKHGVYKALKALVAQPAKDYISILLLPNLTSAVRQAVPLAHFGATDTPQSAVRALKDF